MDFVRDGLTTEEKNILGWADSRLFSNPAFQAIPLLMLEIDIQKKSDGKHVINWKVDSPGPRPGRSGHIPWNVHPLLREVGLRHR